MTGVILRAPVPSLSGVHIFRQLAVSFWPYGIAVTNSSRILLVEDDPALAREIARALTREGRAVDRVGLLSEAFEAIIQHSYRLVLLDRRLPDGEGLSLIAAARSRPAPPSIIVLTARDEITDRIEGLDAGADDYLVKPFALAELMARVRAAFRRPGAAAPSDIVEVGRLTFDLAGREARIAGQPLNLARRELALLELLCRGAGRVVQRDYLDRELYGFDAQVTPNALEIQVSRLRRSLGRVASGVEIATIRGVGYMLRSC